MEDFQEQDSLIDCDEVEKALSEIELKYCPISSEETGDNKNEGLDEILNVLSLEFDSLGLPSLDLNKPTLKILEQVATTSRSLIQVHRRAIGEIKDRNIEHRKGECKNSELYCRLNESRMLLEKSEDKFYALQNKMRRLSQDVIDLKEKESHFNEQHENTKRYYLAKQNELQHSLRKVLKENERLKEICKKDISTPNTTNDVALQLVQKYRTNEDILKTTAQKLQNRNRDLLDEILDLKEDLILCQCKK